MATKGYNAELDEKIQTFGMFKMEEGRGIYVGAHSYDNGPIRVVIQRYEKKNGNRRFYNATRLNGNELALVIKGLRRAEKWYSEQGSSEKETLKKAASKEKAKPKKGGKRPLPSFKSKK